MRDAFLNFVLKEGIVPQNMSYTNYKVIWYNGRRVKIVIAEARNLAHACRMVFSHYNSKRFTLIGAHELGRESDAQPFTIESPESVGHSEWLERMFESDK